jgi:hypothetical protein
MKLSSVISHADTTLSGNRPGCKSIDVAKSKYQRDGKGDEKN